MLVLKRRAGERVALKVSGVIVWVTLVDTERGTARLGFEAPREVVILREETIGEQFAGGAKRPEGGGS